MELHIPGLGLIGSQLFVVQGESPTGQRAADWKQCCLVNRIVFLSPALITAPHLGLAIE